MNFKRVFFLFLMFGSFSLTWAQGDGGQELPPDLTQTNLDEVLSTGQGARRDTRRSSLPFKLKDGLYLAQSRGENSLTYVLVQSYINDPTKSLVIMAPESVIKGEEVGHGWIYQGRSIKQGTEIMLSPLSIDPRTGNLIIDSENERRAPVVLLSKKSDPQERNAYFLQGRNGGLNDEVLEMRPGRYALTRPELRIRPSTNMFVGTSPYESKLVVTNNQVSVHDGDSVDTSYQILSLNGRQGTLAGLVISEFDTMAETEIAYSKVSKIAFFYNLNQLFGLMTDESYERFMLASPAHQKGLYRFEVFQVAQDKKAILQEFFDWLLD